MVIANILFDNDGNFLWVSITAIAAVSAIIINTIIANMTTKANFKANIVAKSRIEWIQEARKNSVEFIASCYDLSKLLGLQKNKQEQDLDSEKEIKRLMNEVKKNGTLLNLYFGPDSSKNNDIIKIIVEEIVFILTNGRYQTIVEDKPAAIYLEALKDFLRIYFKAEWKRANGELKETEVQFYLNQNKVYRKIRHIFLKKVKKSDQDVELLYDYIDVRVNKNNKLP